MNPLDLRGPEFLAFFAVLAIVSLVVAAILRWYLLSVDGPCNDAFDRAGADRFPGDVDPTPNDVAYLVGGPELVGNAMVVRDVHDGNALLDVTSRKLQAEGAIDSLTVAEYRSRFKEFNPSHLERMGLSPSGAQAWKIRIYPALVVAVVATVGWVKVAIGLSRNRPVGFLVVGCCVVSFIAILFLFFRPWATRRGRQLLAHLKTTNSALRTTASIDADRLTGDDLSLCFALFGIDSIGAQHNNLKSMLRPVPSCGSSGCGGGGGGCGGGCGGGGCGGCSS